MYEVCGSLVLSVLAGCRAVGWRTSQVGIITVEVTELEGIAEHILHLSLHLTLQFPFKVCDTTQTV